MDDMNTGMGNDTTTSGMADDSQATDKPAKPASDQGMNDEEETTPTTEADDQTAAPQAAAE